MMTDSLLISALQQPQLFTHPVNGFALIQTHISWVLLTGPYAYKLRKPVNLGFLDFSTLEQRFQDCCNELRLNRRFSPELYSGLIRISGTLERPRLESIDPQQPFDPRALDYAVQMIEFPQQQLLSQRQTLPEIELEQLAQELAQIHAGAPHSPPDPGFGSPAALQAVILDNVERISPYLNSQPALTAQLQRLQQLSDTELQRQLPLLCERQQQGHIRECHGDLHLANIVLYQGRACPFDCIEFNPRYRWIDPLNDLAFLLMDLKLRCQEGLANRILNRYLESSLDYDALPLLPLYQAYRALVRAKICLLSSGSSARPLTAGVQQEYRAYADLAEQLLKPRQARLILMQGVSGSGKSWLSQRLLEQGHWIRLRSDRLRRLWQQQTPELARYSPTMNRITYQRLHKLAASLLASGLSVIIDAAFLRHADRQFFLHLAQQLDIEPLILCCRAAPEVMEQRIRHRLKMTTDPSEATIGVLRQQQADFEPLTEEEQGYANTLDTGCTEQLERCLAAQRSHSSSGRNTGS